MVGRKTPNDSVGIPPRQDRSSESDSGHGILRTRLAEKIVREQVGKLLGDRLHVCSTGDDGRSRRSGKRNKTIPGGLDETATLEGHVEEELRVAFAGKRPETSTGTTGGNDDVEAGNFADGAERIGGVVAEGGGDMDGGGHGQRGDCAWGEEGGFRAETGRAWSWGHEAGCDSSTRTVLMLWTKVKEYESPSARDI